MRGACHLCPSLATFNGTDLIAENKNSSLKRSGGQWPDLISYRVGRQLGLGYFWLLPGNRRGEVLFQEDPFS